MLFLKIAYWSLLFLVVTSVGLLILWLSLSSAYFLRVTDISYDPKTHIMTLDRTVIGNQNIHARWYMAVGNEGSIRECSDQGVDVYEPRFPDMTPKTRASFVVGGDLVDCLDRPFAFISGSWQVLWKGVLPLRPTYFFKSIRDPGEPL